MGFLFEVSKWDPDAQAYDLAWQGSDFDEAIEAMNKLRVMGHGCICMEWRPTAADPDLG